MKILIIEDQDSDFETLDFLFLKSKSLGTIQLTRATDLSSSINTLSASSFDIVFVDLELPDSSGLKTLTTLSSHCFEIPIVVMTDSRDESVELDALRLGADDYINKSAVDTFTLEKATNYSIERFRIKRELKKSKEDAINASKVKEEFLAIMSHEIRTPLNIITGASDLLMESHLNPQQERLVHLFQKGSEHLLSLIDNILDITKLENEELRMARESFSLQKTFTYLTEITSMACRQRNIRFDAYFSSKIPELIIGDERRIKQMFLNLITNSLKFTTEGKITLKAELVSKTKSRCQLRFSVSDTGIGLNSGDAKKIFGSFYQVDTDLQRKYGGAGLGLSITKKIVDYYNGEINVISEPDKGTHFEILLGFQIDKSPPARDFLDATIFINSSDCLLAGTLKEQLELRGAKVTLEANKDNAINALNYNNFDYILLDVQVPENLAFTLFDSLEKKQKENVVLVYPLVQRSSDLKMASERGIEQMLFKPITFENLDKIISPNPFKPKSNTSSKEDKNILIVDDDFENREIIGAFLKNTEYSFDIASSGIDALGLLEKKDYDLVLMDIQMPEMNGLETVERIRANSRFQDLPVVALSANTFAQDIIATKEAGFNDFLGKPIRKEELLCFLKDFNYETKKIWQGLR